LAELSIEATPAIQKVIACLYRKIIIVSCIWQLKLQSECNKCSNRIARFSSYFKL